MVAASTQGLATAGSAIPIETAWVHGEGLDADRQEFLDGFFIPAAVLQRDGTGAPYVVGANRHFRELANWDERLKPDSAGRIPFLSGSYIGEALRHFLDSGEQYHQFESNDGRHVGGRYFTATLARLTPTAAEAQRCLLSLVDKTAQVEMATTLRSEMLRDSLTGLPNRLALNERVTHILTRQGFRENSYAVVAIDMTRFSRVNESMGALAGDELLVAFARRTLSALRPGDFMARTAGDEFAVLMRLENGVEDALGLGARLKKVLSDPFRLSELEIRVDCSIGCALLTRRIEIPEEVLRNAQFALKHAKQSAHIEVYEPTHVQIARRRFSIETELRRAIDNEQLRLAFQPLVHLPTGTVSGFEALARWEHPQQGEISPAEFIAVAEESGLIMPLGRWAIDAATSTLSGWDEKAGRELPLRVAVNLSPLQLARDDVPALVGRALAASGLAGRRLTLELTESAIVRDPQHAQQVLEALKLLEVRIALDDFGTGYTSMSYLQRLPIDILKIDRSFITGMLRDPGSIAIVRAILSLAEALAMDVTAEGVETSQVAHLLTGLGCTHGQGYYYAEAMEPDAALEYWIRSTAEGQPDLAGPSPG